MGCCSSKKDRLKNSNNNKATKIEEINIESQEKELINILTEVSKEIDALKNEVNYIILLIYNIQALTNEIYSGSIENEKRVKGITVGNNNINNKKMLLSITITNICKMGYKSSKC